MRPKNTDKKLPLSASLWLLLTLALALLLPGCAAPPKPLPTAPVRSVQIPALPSYARQPTTPSACWQTCLDALTSERELWHESLTTGVSPGVPVSGSTTKPAKP